MLTLFDGTTSVCAIKVRLALHEKGIKFKSHNIDLRAGDQFEPSYLKLNPNAVVPTLVDDSRVIVESSVILHYVDEMYSRPPLMPKDPENRAQVRIWMKRMDDTVHPSIGSLTHATAYRPAFLSLNKEEQALRLSRIPDQNRRDRFATVYEEGLEASLVVNAVKVIDKLIRDMEEVLVDTKFLAGDTYSLAECAVTPYVNRLFDLGLLGLWAVKAPNVFRWFSESRGRKNFPLSITDYLTDADRLLFGGVDPEAAVKIKGILETA
tara:strand:+ start:1685 stop:2479 length:795 start_codon:yes stop_codon:yes gene_type:complete